MLRIKIRILKSHNRKILKLIKINNYQLLNAIIIVSIMENVLMAFAFAIKDILDHCAV